MDKLFDVTESVQRIIDQEVNVAIENERANYSVEDRRKLEKLAHYDRIVDVVLENISIIT